METNLYFMSTEYTIQDKKLVRNLFWRFGKLQKSAKFAKFNAANVLFNAMMT